MKKSSRQGIIKKIIQEQDIETQEDLLEALISEGVQATQATISRDIRELGIVKGRNGEGRTKYVLHTQVVNDGENRLKEVVEESVKSISQVQFMVVVQTYLGAANIIGAIIDDLGLENVAGTLAGANTLSIITTSNEAATELEKQLQGYLK